MQPIGHADVCTALVDAGASITARDRWNRTPLAIAQQTIPPNPKLVKALTKATKKRVAELRQAEATEGRYRSDMVEVRARGRFERMARDEATRRVSPSHRSCHTSWACPLPLDLRQDGPEYTRVWLWLWLCGSWLARSSESSGEIHPGCVSQYS